MQQLFSKTGNDSRIGKYAALMTDAVLRPTREKTIDVIEPIKIATKEPSFRKIDKCLPLDSVMLKIKSCDPVMPSDIVLSDLKNVKDIETLTLDAFVVSKSNLYVPDSKFMLWTTDPSRLIVASINNGSFVHVFEYPALNKCYSVYFEKEIISIDFFKHTKFSNVLTVVAILFKDDLQVSLYGLPLHCRSEVIELDMFMELNIYPQDYPTCVDCKLNYVAIGYRNGDIAVFKLTEIPMDQPLPFYHKYTHTSLVSSIHLPIYVGDVKPFNFVISSGISGKIIYSEFSIKQAHGGVAISTSAAIPRFVYLDFIDGVLFCDFDDSVKFSTFFSRTELRRLVTIRGGVSSVASSSRHPFIAFGGLGGALAIFNTNHTRVKHGKSYIYCYSIFKNIDGRELYLFNLDKLPKEAPQSLRTDGSSVHIPHSTKIDALCWSPEKVTSNIVAQLCSQIISFQEL
eukprot:NODE_159_length_16647_cov_0.251390.p4 type:complete len:456 gc:universal NODE_159_length_16647_cov_0.251390:5294-6661(+)